MSEQQQQQQHGDEILLKEAFPCFDCYTGSSDALVRVGVVERHQLPGQPGRPKTRVTYLPDGSAIGSGRGAKSRLLPGFREVRASRRADQYTVLLTVPHEEQQRRAAAVEAERQAARTRAAQQRELDGLVKTPAEYRRRNMELARALLESLQASFEGTHAGGFCMDEASLESIESACRYLLHTVQHATLAFDPSAHAQALANCGVQDDQAQTLATAAAPGGSTARGTLRSVGP